MVDKNVREIISESCEDSILFDNPSFDKSILGITSEGNVVYSFEKMIKELADDDGISDMDAVEFIEYNTIRALPYASEPKPIILYELEF